MEARATSAISAYGPALEGEFASRPVIYAAGDTPEQQENRATAIAEARAAAREASGVSGLTPYQITQNSEQLANIDGKYRGAAYRTRVQTRRS